MTAAKPANPLPVTAHGPPPKAPLPAATRGEDRVARHRRRAELLQQGKDIRAAEKTLGSPLRKRFWKEVSIREEPGKAAPLTKHIAALSHAELEGFHIYLDNRPVRTPSKAILTIPRTKPHLAAAIALEWDLLVSTQQALKQHFIPLTSLFARAEDLREQDRTGDGHARKEIVTMAMRYLDTDTLLCWAPESRSSTEAHDEGQNIGEPAHATLRDVQIRTAQPIIGFLQTHIWPGVEIHPVTDPASIIPVSQPQFTKDIIRGWISGLPASELAGLERAILASKGLLSAARFVVEWSPDYAHLRKDTDGSERQRFGVSEAAEAASLEVRWQTGVWGEVEDTHDVEKEDLRRQLGSVILLVSGEDRQ
ncbi:MAG: ATP synthase complex assembly protein atp12 [Caeruleum heppii]|nr:MAG: ATP synthase complex assembly protein atp12 [Caeruleum heppii]